MKISELINELKKVQKDCGDLSVQIHSREYQNCDIPGAYGFGGAGMTNVWHGSVDAIKQSEKYPNQLEIWTVK